MKRNSKLSGTNVSKLKMAAKALPTLCLMAILIFTGCRLKDKREDKQLSDSLPVSARERLWGQEKKYTNWNEHKTRTINNLDLPVIESPKFSVYGGWLDRRVTATGFFHTKKIDGRWWLVDPEGYLYIDRGLCSVRPIRSERAQEVFDEKFGDKKNWIRQTTDLIKGSTFSSIGGFSDTSIPLLKHLDTPLNYCPIMRFMKGYAQEIKGIERYSIETKKFYVFEKAFREYCMEKAERIIVKGEPDGSNPEQPITVDPNDPHLIGYFSDNELPFDLNYLDYFLNDEQDSETYLATLKWFSKRKGNTATSEDITEKDRLAFIKYLAEEYFKIVSHAIRKYDSKP